MTANRAIPIDADELARLRASHARIGAALLAYMDDHNIAHDAANDDEPNTRRCPCDYCKQARAALASAAAIEDAARMAAGFGEALELTRRAVEP